MGSLMRIPSTFLLCALVAVWTAGCGGSSSGGGSNGGSGGNGGGGGNNSPTTVTYNFTSGTPTAVAVKTGSGSYSAVSVISNTASFSVPAGTSNFSVAYLCPPYPLNPPSVQQETIDFESTADGTTYTGYCGFGIGQSSTLGSLTGTVDASVFSSATSMSYIVRGVSSAGTLYLDTNNGLPVSGSFQIQAPVGSDHFVLALTDSSSTVIAAKGYSNQTVPGAMNGGNTVSFTSADAVIPRAITYTNLPAGAGSPSTYAGVDFLELANGNLTQYPELPAGVLTSDSYYTINSSVGFPSSGVSTFVGYNTYPSNGGAVTIPFPDLWTTTGPTPGPLPMFVFDYTGFAGKSNVDYAGGLFWTETGATLESQLFVNVSKDYLGSSTSVAVPDLSGVSGFLSPPSTGTSVLWRKEIVSGIYPSSSSVAGGKRSYVEAYGTYKVP